MASPIDITVRHNRLPKIAAAMEPRAIKIVSASAANIQRGYQERVHVITGTLRRSATQDPQTNAIEKRIGPSVGYGKYEELGTRYRPPHPALLPAYLAELPRFMAAWKELVDA